MNEHDLGPIFSPGSIPAHWKRSFSIFLSGQAVSIFGSSLVQYAIMWHITITTGSGVMMTLSVLCGFLPMFALAPFAGVWADRFDRKRLIVLADAFVALVTLGLALVYLTGYHAIWTLLAAQALRAVGSAVQGPAVGAILPQIVPEDKLTWANGINGSIQSAIMLVSPMAAGALLSIAPIFTIFFIDVVTAALAIGTFLAFLRVPTHAKAAAVQNTGYFEDMRLGFRYIREHRYLVAFFSYVALLLLLFTPATFLTPLQVTRSFGSQVWRLTAIEMAFSIGMMAGGAAIAVWGGFRNRMHTMLASNAVMAACSIALGLIGSFPPYLVVMALFGMSMPFYNTPAAVMIQEHVEEAFLGRVFSVQTMLFTSVMPLAMLVFGPLAELLRIEWLLLATGALMAALVLPALGNRRLIQAGVPLRTAAVEGVG